MADESGGTPNNDDQNSGGKPNDDTEGLKRALEEQTRKAREAENQLKQLRVEMASKAKESDTSKSEMQKLTERVEAAEKKQAEADARALKAEVAHAKGLTADQARRLSGSTKEELEEDAEDMVQAFGLDKKTDDKTQDDTGNGARRRPQEDLQPGAVPGAEPEKSPDQIADEVLKSGSF